MAFDEQAETVDYLTNARNHVRKGFADSLRKEHEMPPEAAPGIPAGADEIEPTGEMAAEESDPEADGAEGEQIPITVSPAELALLKKLRGEKSEGEEDMAPDGAEMMALGAEDAGADIGEAVNGVVEQIRREAEDQNRQKAARGRVGSHV